MQSRTALVTGSTSGSGLATARELADRGCHGIKAVPLAMMERRWERIVNTSSVLGMAGAPHKLAYVASKLGLIGLAKPAAIEVAGHGNTCNAVCAGTVLTALIEKQIAPQAVATGLSEDQVMNTVFLQNIPSRKLISAEHLAATVAFLCSDEAASITGAAIAVDGGYTAH
jgi:3-hydroxybutyrate dehydrogenase